MAKIIIKGFVQLASHSKLPAFNNFDMSKYGDIMIAPHEFEYDMPDDFNPIAAEVDMLNKKKNELADEYHGKQKQLDERIANLLCIEHTPTPTRYCDACDQDVTGPCVSVDCETPDLPWPK